MLLLSRPILSMLSLWWFILLLCSLVLSLLSVPTLVLGQSNMPLRIAVILHGNAATAGNYSFSLTNSASTIISQFSLGVTPQVVVQAVKLWESRVLAVGGILLPQYQTRVPLEITFFNVGPASPVASPVVLNLASQIANPSSTLSSTVGKFNVILSPSPSTDGVQLAFFEACETSKQCLVVAPLTSNPRLYICMQNDCPTRLLGSRRYDYTSSVLNDPTYVLEGHSSVLRNRGVRNVAVFYPTTELGALANSTIASGLSDLGMNVAISYGIPPSAPLTNASDSAPIVAQQLARSGAEALLWFCVVGDVSCAASIAALFAALKRINYTPKAIAIGGGGEATAAPLMPDAGVDLAYVMAAQPWDASLKGASYRTFNSSYDEEFFPTYYDDERKMNIEAPRNFYESFFNRNPAFLTLPSSLLAIATQVAATNVAGLTYIQKAIQVLSATDVESIRSGLGKVSHSSFFGKLQLDVWGRWSQTEQIVNQIVLDKNTTNGLRISAQKNYLTPISIGVDAVFPMPTWEERQWVDDRFDTPAEKLVIGVTAAVLAYCVVLFCAVIYFRTHPVVKASTPIFCLLVITGGILMLLSNFVTPLNSVTSSLCMSSIWLLTLGFNVMYSALFTKTFRVWRIFQQGKLRVVRITTKDLWHIQLALSSFDLLLNTIWNANNPMGVAIVVPDPLRPKLNYQQCNVDSTQLTYIYITIVFKGVLIVAGVILTWLARNVPSQFNETPYLAVCIYNCFVSLCFLLPLVATQMGGRETSYYIRAFGIFFVVLSTLSILLVPKLWLIYQGRDDGSNTVLPFYKGQGGPSIIAVDEDNTPSLDGSTPKKANTLNGSPQQTNGQINGNGGTPNLPGTPTTNGHRLTSGPNHSPKDGLQLAHFSPTNQSSHSLATFNLNQQLQQKESGLLDGGAGGAGGVGFTGLGMKRSTTGDMLAAQKGLAARASGSSRELNYAVTRESSLARTTTGGGMAAGVLTGGHGRVAFHGHAENTITSAASQPHSPLRTTSSQLLLAQQQQQQQQQSHHPTSGLLTGSSVTGGPQASPLSLSRLLDQPHHLGSTVSLSSPNTPSASGSGTGAHLASPSSHLRQFPLLSDNTNANARASSSSGAQQQQQQQLAHENLSLRQELEALRLKLAQTAATTTTIPAVAGAETSSNTPSLSAAASSSSSNLLRSHHGHAPSVIAEEDVAALNQHTQQQQHATPGGPMDTTMTSSHQHTNSQSTSASASAATSGESQSDSVTCHSPSNHHLPPLAHHTSATAAATATPTAATE